jgi:5'-nucleotidase
MLLLTNDDGIDAPGLAALQAAVGDAEQPLIVAPLHPMSECSHCVTTKRPLTVHPRGPRRFAVAGTPADCVRVALLHLLPSMNLTPDPATLTVLSGINAGGNLGADVYISGTVAAAREAAFFGFPAIALSQYRRAEPGPAEWQRVAAWARHALQTLSGHTLRQGEFWNVNFPWPLSPPPHPVPSITFCERSRRPLPVKYDETEAGLSYVAGRYHLRDFEPGSDIDVCFSGNISITRITL